MRSGKLRHRVTLQAPTNEQDATGSEVITYPTDTVSVWAEVLELRGREYISAREQHSELTTKIRIRYREDIGVLWRAVHGTRVYDVIHVVDLMGKRRELELMCAEIR